jgi:hypothetical protein
LPEFHIARPGPELRGWWLGDPDWSRLVRLRVASYPWCVVCGATRQLTAAAARELAEEEALTLEMLQTVCRDCADGVE